MTGKWKSKMCDGHRECYHVSKTIGTGQTSVFPYAQVLSGKKYKKANIGAGAAFGKEV